VNQLRFIKRLIVETGTDENQLLGFVGFDALENIPKAEVNRVIKMLEQNKREAA
jgi:phage regulator Rha-like protein